MKGVERKIRKTDTGEETQDKQKSVMKELQKIIEEWEQKVRPYRDSPIITYHRSWIYLSQWLGLRVV